MPGHSIFRFVRLFCRQVNFADAVLGKDAEIPTIGGKVKINIKPGTQPVEILRLKGKGLKEVNSYSIGDQLVHINIYTPMTVSNEEKVILEKLREAPNFQPRAHKNDKSFFDKMKDFFH